MRIPLVGQTYTPRSTAAGAQTCLNVYPELTEDPNEREKGIGALYGCPGRHVFKDLTSIDAAATPVRGVWSGGGRLFVAAGTKYMELNSSGTLVGSVRTIQDLGSHTPVQFFANGTQLFIVSDGVCYVDNGSGPTIISLPTFTGFVDRFGSDVIWSSGDHFDAGFFGQTITINGTPYTVQNVMGPDNLTLTGSPAGSDVTVAYSCAPTMSALTGAFLDGYFLVNRPNTRQFNWCPLLDGTNQNTYTWDPLDFAIKESYPDYIRAILAANEQLYLFGTETSEIWQKSSGNDPSITWERIDGATFNLGTISAWSPIVINNGVYFLGTNRNGQVQAFRMNGFTPQRVSTYAEEAQWALASPANAYSYGYTEDGHTFWVFHIDTVAWGFDTKTGQWHSRSAWNGSAFTAYPTYYHTFIAEFGSNGKHITGGIINGTLYESSVDFYDDAGSDIKWQRALPYAYNEGKWVISGRTELEMETGTVPSGPEPTVSLDYSDDRGASFVDPVTAGIGTAGDASKTVYWPPTGAFLRRVYRISGVGQQKVALVDMNQDRINGVV